MSFNAHNILPSYFLLYAIAMIFVVPRETRAAEVLFWGGMAATFVLVALYARFATATGDVAGCAGLLGFLFGGIAVWLLRGRGFAPEVVALLPWGGALCGAAVQVAGVGVLRLQRGVRDSFAAKAVSGLDPESDALVASLLHRSLKVREKAKDRLFSTQRDAVAIAGVIRTVASRNLERQGGPEASFEIRQWMPRLVGPLVDRGEEARSALLELYAGTSDLYEGAVELIEDAVFGLPWPDDGPLRDAAERRLAAGHNVDGAFDHLWGRDRGASVEFAERAFLACALSEDRILRLEPGQAALILDRAAALAAGNFFGRYREIIRAAAQLPPALGFPVLERALDWDPALGYRIEWPFEEVTRRLRSAEALADQAQPAPGEAASLLRAVERHLARFDEAGVGRPRELLELAACLRAAAGG